MKNVFSGLLVVAAMALTGCRSASPLAGPPPDAWHIPKTKVALYLDVGCKGGGVIHWAELLRSSPDVDVTYISGEQIAEGALDHADALVIPGGQQKGMWRAARPLIEQFKACGHPVYAACKDMQGEKQ